MIRAVIFDLDGVLVDSEPLSCAATADLLTLHGFAMSEPEVRRLFLGKSMAAVFEHARAHGVELPADLGAQKERLYAERSRGTLRAFEGAHEIVAAIAAKLPVAIASSGSPKKVEFSLAETGLAPFFPVICTTSECARGKPAPDVFLLAAKKLGVDPTECAVIEDAPPGLEAARAAGAFVIGVTTSLPREALGSAHAIVDSLRELPALVLA